MKNILVFLILIPGFISIKAQAQWLEYYYAFELKDPDGNLIDASNSEYKMVPVKNNDSSPVLLNIEICNDNKTWRYTEGYKDFDKINKLRIDRLKNGIAIESMMIEFPPAFNMGKEQYYCNLYAGIIKFKKGFYKIKLPKKNRDWNSLRKLKLCAQSYNYDYDGFLDISKFQK